MALSLSLRYNVIMKRSNDILGNNRKTLNICLIIANLAVLVVLGFVLFQHQNSKVNRMVKTPKNEQVSKGSSSSSKKAKKEDKTQLKKEATTALRRLTTPMMSLPLITLSEGNQMMLRVRWSF